MNCLLTAVVMPCLNEERTLEKTCRSLGFADSLERASNAKLIIVDNGSTDATLAIASDIQKNAEPGNVVIAQESERGYVPPRHRGNLVAREIASLAGISDSKVLILQADADTSYSKEYVAEMRRVAERVPHPSFMLRAMTTYPPELQSECASFLELCERIDGPFEHLLTDHPDDVIVDDKACGYRLSDYFTWGGHRREFADWGDEIHSETTRLYIRALSFGCRAALVNNAIAIHSPRRLFEHPAIEFATSGYPRDSTWLREWKQALESIDSMGCFEETSNLALREAIRWRQIHILALFGILPLHVAHTLGKVTSLNGEEWSSRVTLPVRSVKFLRENVADMIIDSLVSAEQAIGPHDENLGSL
jgi:glycosyltransferase involved in cell wall biosynthesis